MQCLFFTSLLNMFIILVLHKLLNWKTYSVYANSKKDSNYFSASQGFTSNLRKLTHCKPSGFACLEKETVFYVLLSHQVPCLIRSELELCRLAFSSFVTAAASQLYIIDRLVSGVWIACRWKCWSFYQIFTLTLWLNSHQKMKSWSHMTEYKEV